MNLLKNIGLPALVALIVAMGGTFLVAPNYVPKTFSALSSPDIMSPYFSVGGVRFWAASDSDLTQATTTVCALQSPAATSTLIGGGIRFTVSSTTASTVTIAKAATAFATTTLIREASVGANAFATILAASTTESALAQTNRIFGPSEWLVVGMAGGVGTFSPTGICEAVWIEN